MTRPLTPAEVAARESLSVGRIRQLLSAGRIEGAYRHGSRYWLIPQDYQWQRRKAGRPRKK